MKHLLVIIILATLICQTTQAIAQEECDFNFLDITLEPIAKLNGKPVNGTVCNYRNNGNIWFSISYKEGKEDGAFRRYYKNGKLEFEIPYKNDQLEGTRRNYYESGKLESEVSLINGKIEGMSRTYYASGKLKHETPYKNGKMEGAAKIYSENSKLRMTVIYKNNVAISGTCSDGRSLTSAEIINWENGYSVSCNE